jgi:hypothetical protein
VRGPDAAVLGTEAATAGARRHLGARGPLQREAQVAAVAIAYSKATVLGSVMKETIGFLANHPALRVP